MSKTKVAVVRYQTPLESVRKAVELCRGLDHVPAGASVFIKPNIVFWTQSVEFPKWGVITTSRVIHDMVVLLKERGIDRITIGEGTVVYNPKDKETAAHSHEILGYNALKKRYGVQVLNVLERPFEKVRLADDLELKFNADYLHSDFVVNIPVMKTHAQAVVSLGIKNLKGMIDVNSRKKCHSPDLEKDLHYTVSKLMKTLPPSFTIIDGIYTNERGPGFDGKIRRSDLLVASPNVLAADKVGATILGHEPSKVPHLVHAAKDANMPIDLSDVEVVGEKIENVAMRLEHAFKYNEAGTLPLPMEKMGIKGLAYPKYDLTICTYCSILTGMTLTAVAYAWKGQAWDNVEILTGKLMKPTPGKKTVLIGKCLYEANKDNPDIGKMISVKTCPPSPDAVVKALHQVGVEVNPEIFKHMDMAPGFFTKKYEGKPEFDESFFRIE
ncbi:MAG: DUF362 domain-containing protein [Desulfomonile tiedjei]|nr:DUF362 domain-containing protein [Desulfomonile tiedjei]